jgi:hypothetical protein
VFSCSRVLAPTQRKECMMKVVNSKYLVQERDEFGTLLQSIDFGPAADTREATLRCYLDWCENTGRCVAVVFGIKKKYRVTWKETTCENCGETMVCQVFKTKPMRTVCYHCEYKR